jgi:hypothetical protein
MRRLITVDDPRVACDTLMWEDGTLLVVLTWHAAEPLTVSQPCPRRRADQPGWHGG